MTDNKKLGIKGEKLTAKFLKKNKYKILLRNFTTNDGEIDIIARNNKYIVFVEVKTRSESSMLSPRFAVDSKKKARIIKTANIFLKKYKTDLQPRFDVSEVIINNDGKMEVEYLENAFS